MYLESCVCPPPMLFILYFHSDTLAEFSYSFVVPQTEAIYCFHYYVELGPRTIWILVRCSYSSRQALYMYKYSCNYSLKIIFVCIWHPKLNVLSILKRSSFNVHVNIRDETMLLRIYMLPISSSYVPEVLG